MIFATKPYRKKLHFMHVQCGIKTFFTFQWVRLGLFFKRPPCTTLDPLSTPSCRTLAPPLSSHPQYSLSFGNPLAGYHGTERHLFDQNVKTHPRWQSKLTGYYGADQTIVFVARCQDLVPLTVIRWQESTDMNNFQAFVLCFLCAK